MWKAAPGWLSCQRVTTVSRHRCPLQLSRSDYALIRYSDHSAAEGTGYLYYSS